MKTIEDKRIPLILFR